MYGDGGFLYDSRRPDRGADHREHDWINDNIATFLNNVAGVTKDVKGTIVWAADEVVYAPEIAVTDVRVDAIARGESEGGGQDR